MASDGRKKLAADAGQRKKSTYTDNLKGVIRKAEGILETAILTGIYYAVWKWSYRGDTMPAYYGSGKYLLAAVYAFLIFVMFYLCECFQYGHRKLSEIVVAQAISMGIVDLVTYFQLCLTANQMISLFPVLLVYILDIAAILCTFTLFTAIYHRMYVPKNMVMIYGNEKAVDLKFKMDTRPDKYCITKIISCQESFEKIQQEIETHNAVVINDVPSKIWNDIMKYCYTHEVRTYMVPKISDIISRSVKEITLFDTPLLVKGGALNLVKKAVKRIFDILLCLIVLIPSLPIMAVVAVCIQLEDHGPVFYRQTRVTESGRTFDILKLCSMIVDAEKDGRSVPATGRDPRITKVGSVIRPTRLDELPQILNIPKGDRGIIGTTKETLIFQRFVQA